MAILYYYIHLIAVADQYFTFENFYKISIKYDALLLLKYPADNNAHLPDRATGVM